MFRFYTRHFRHVHLTALHRLFHLRHLVVTKYQVLWFVIKRLQTLLLYILVLRWLDHLRLPNFYYPNRFKGYTVRHHRVLHYAGEVHQRLILRQHDVRYDLPRQRSLVKTASVRRSVQLHETITVVQDACDAPHVRLKLFLHVALRNCKIVVTGVYKDVHLTVYQLPDPEQLLYTGVGAREGHRGLEEGDQHVEVPRLVTHPRRYRWRVYE